MTMGLAGGLVYGGRRYVARGGRVVVRGRVSPFRRGQLATVEVFRQGRLVRRYRVPIRRSGRGGRFSVRFVVGGRGTYTVRARHDQTAEQARFGAPSKRFRSVTGRAARGSRGLKVRLLQRSLARLGFVTPQSGRFGAATARAVLAFKKTNRMVWNGYADSRVFSMLLRGRGGFRLRYPRAGKHVEFDQSRQVLVLARRGRAERIYHASSGKPSTPTVFGTFSFYRRQPGTNSHGMVHSWYFIRGYAIHGYASVPTYPASHGCIRVPIPDARSVYNWIRMGQRIFVYR